VPYNSTYNTCLLINYLARTTNYVVRIGKFLLAIEASQRKTARLFAFGQRRMVEIALVLVAAALGVRELRRGS
jgi:hypothetical protein